MKLITRDTDYAVRALCFIAGQKNKVVSVSELVRALNAPRPFLRKILQALNRYKILRSYKGQGGGFELAKTIDKIYLTDLIEIFQGKFKLNVCMFKKNICPNTVSCRLKGKISAIEQYVVIQLKSITIGSLLKGE